MGGTGWEQALLLTIYALHTTYSALPAYNVSPLTFFLLLTHTFATHSLLTLSSLHIPGQLYIPCVLPACSSTRVLLTTHLLLAYYSLLGPSRPAKTLFTPAIHLLPITCPTTTSPLKHCLHPLLPHYSSLAQQPHPANTLFTPATHLLLITWPTSASPLKHSSHLLLTRHSSLAQQPHPH